MDQMTITGILIAGIGALATVVGVLWTIVTADKKRTEKKLDECEQDRKELHVKIGGLSERVERLESKPE